MKLAVISFTKNGIALSQKIAERVIDLNVQLYTKCSRYQDKADICENGIRGVTQAVCETKDPSTEKHKIRFVEESLAEWVKQHMIEDEAILFIGACGIAVRAIAPNLTDKLHDVPVLVMDEMGQYVIPILAGHVGGANELAHMLADAMQAQEVITTATDIQDKFAVDLFAKKHHLQILNKDGIAKVSAKVLAGEEITIFIEHAFPKKSKACMYDAENDTHRGDNTKLCSRQDSPDESVLHDNMLRLVAYPPTKKVDIIVAEEPKQYDALIYLRPKQYVVGMGCRRDKDPAQLIAFYRETLKDVGIEEEQVYAIASIDKKKDESGLIAICQKARIPFLVYTAEELLKVDGDFHASAFVASQVGVDNVCERAALAGCGANGKLIYEKHAKDGMTISIAKREWSVTFDEK